MSAGLATDSTAHAPEAGPHLPVLLYVVNSLNAGGTERLVVDMSLAFSKQYTVVVACLDEPGVWADDLRCRGVAVHCLWRQPGLDLSMPVRLAKLCKTSGATIIHAHQCTPWFYAALARLLYRKPRLLLEEHGRFYPEVDSPRRRWLNRLLIRRLTHRFVAVSGDIRQRLERYEGLDAAQIDVVYNGVRAAVPLASDVRTALRSQLGFGPEDLVVGTVGRLDPIKNLPMLVGALAKASASHNGRVKGLLVGGGPEYGRIAGMVAQTGLQQEVRLTGFRSDARQLAQCMDLFVLSSFSEGTSIALLEAMAAGVPTAVTAVGGNPEVVVDGSTGWVVPSDATDALAAVIVRVHDDRAYAEQMGRNGQMRFLSHFSFDRMIDRYAEIYRELQVVGT